MIGRSLSQGLILGGSVFLLAACVQPGDQALYAPNDCAYVEDNFGAHAAIDHFSKGSPVYKEGYVLACDQGGQ